jgi:hypothetical protein
MMMIWFAILGLGGIVFLILPSDPQALGGAITLLAVIAWVIAGGTLIPSRARQFALLAFLFEAGAGLNYAGGLEGRAPFPDYGSLGLLAVMCAVLLWIPYQLVLIPLRWARREGVVTPEVFAGLVNAVIPTLFLPFNTFLGFSLPTAVLFFVIPDSKLIQEATLRLAPLTVIFLACAQWVVLRGIRRFVSAYPSPAKAYAFIPISERSVLLWGVGLAAAGCVAEIWRGDWILWIGSAGYLIFVVHTLSPLWVQKPLAFLGASADTSVARAQPSVFLPGLLRYAIWLTPLSIIYLIALAIALSVTRP